jgi:plasmid stabilization system protein ParE
VDLNEIRWHPDAEVDAEEAKNWYAERSTAAAHGFLLALEHSLRTVADAPDRWPVDRFGCRCYVFPNRYPFNLIYRLREHIEVVAVAHQRRHPDYWTVR